MIVVDTNVMVYLLTGGERGADAAELLRADSQWIAPALLLSELRNVLVGLIRGHGLSPEDARDMHLDAAALLGDRVVHVDGGRVLRTALECDLSAYDAEFVVAARTLGLKLVSADQAILAGAPDVAVALPTGRPPERTVS